MLKLLCLYLLTASNFRALRDEGLRSLVEAIPVREHEYANLGVYRGVPQRFCGGDQFDGHPMALISYQLSQNQRFSIKFYENPSLLAS